MIVQVQHDHAIHWEALDSVQIDHALADIIALQETLRPPDRARNSLQPMTLSWAMRCIGVAITRVADLSGTNDAHTVRC